MNSLRQCMSFSWGSGFAEWGVYLWDQIDSPGLRGGTELHLSLIIQWGGPYPLSLKILSFCSKYTVNNMERVSLLKTVLVVMTCSCIPQLLQLVVTIHIHIIGSMAFGIVTITTGMTEEFKSVGKKSGVKEAEGVYLLEKG